MSTSPSFLPVLKVQWDTRPGAKGLLLTFDDHILMQFSNRGHAKAHAVRDAIAKALEIAGVDFIQAIDCGHSHPPQKRGPRFRWDAS